MIIASLNGKIYDVLIKNNLTVEVVLHKLYMFMKKILSYRIFKTFIINSSKTTFFFSKKSEL
jgi:type III secretory pathway component EscV